MPTAARLALCAALLSAAAPGRDDETRQAAAIRVSERIHIDGVLDEKVWTEHPGIGPLVQQDPHPGAAPSEPTEVHVAYNENAIFIAVDCRDSCGREVRATQMQRDGSLLFDDYIQVLIDTRHDLRNAYYFATNPAGVMVDGTISENNTPTSTGTASGTCAPASPPTAGRWK